MKRVLIVLFLLLVLPLISSESCTIVERSSCTTNIIMGTSNLTNAHGELASQENYDYVLCCDFGIGNTTCSGTNKIIGLEFLTNSHAEIPSLDSYTNDICYEDLVCSNKISCDDSSEIGVISLSSETDAHIGATGDYATKICCSGMCDSGEEFIEGQCILKTIGYWANTNGEYITQKNVIVEQTQILLRLVNSKLSAGTEVTFNIYEQDPLLPDLIKSISGTIDSNENANVTWTVTQADIDATGETNFDEFYFEVSGETSNLLNISLMNSTSCSFITLCSDYEGQDECEQDTCSAGEFSIESKDSEVSCGAISLDPQGCQTWVSCGCTWMNNTCSSKKVENIQADCEVGGNPSEIGSCFYSESTSDDCADGFLSYTWGSNWSWAANNTFDINPDGGVYVLGTDLKWHYDSNLKSGSCIDGSKTVPCPAQIRLPFFGMLNLIFVMMVIGIIYYFFRKQKFIRNI